MSPRPRKGRFCHPFDGANFYKPRGVPLSSLEILELGQDEFEAMRLCDLENVDQGTAAEKMGISQQTISRLLASGRKKTIEALAGGKALNIVGGEHIKSAQDLFSSGGFGCRRRFRRGR